MLLFHMKVKISLVAVSLFCELKMDYFFHTKLIKFLPIFLAGMIYSLIILTYLMPQLKTQFEDESTVYKRCIEHCEKATDNKNIIHPQYKLPSNFSESTCSAKATSRGRNQQVITFSFFGDIKSLRSYFKGIEWNAELIRELYPGWVMRVYHNIRDPQENNLLCQMLCNNWDILDTCFVGDLPGYGNLTGSQPNVWRFLAMSDPLVDIALSRDLDSNLNEREVAAVQEWFETNATMHVMRDHPEHTDVMLAGMWGARINGSNRQEWRDIIERILLRAKVAGGFGLDQVLLAEIVWSYASRPGWVLQHDSYYCQKFNGSGKMASFPTARLRGSMNFVGSRFIIDYWPMTSECPLPCRRQPNWTLC